MSPEGRQWTEGQPRRWLSVTFCAGLVSWDIASPTRTRPATVSERRRVAQSRDRFHFAVSLACRSALLSLKRLFRVPEVEFIVDDVGRCDVTGPPRVHPRAPERKQGFCTYKEHARIIGYGT